VFRWRTDRFDTTNTVRLPVKGRDAACFPCSLWADVSPPESANVAENHGEGLRNRLHVDVAIDKDVQERNPVNFHSRNGIVILRKTSENGPVFGR
jgi:hypothetical protein